MSMISSLIDELRELVGDGSMEWVAGPVRASVLREAADTIWELRDDLQQAHRENAKLREERDTYRDLVGCMVHPDIPDQLAAENAKLRELVSAYQELATYPRCSLYDECMPDSFSHACAECDGTDCCIQRLTDGLGVEVDA